ncbi:E3 SUMO-protein ligase RanBP2-like isoform X1 [Styela clava]
MSRSIEQVEALVSKAVRYAKSEKELSIKGLNFGRWWNEVGEYEKASKWITRYLVIYDKDAKAHKLLGEIYEKLDRSDAALACYKSSLRVKPQQYELMLKVAEMHINPGPTQNPNRAQVWLDKAAVALPNHPQVYKLKMELYLAQEAPSSRLEETILQELKKRPNDPSLYVEYVTFLKNQERLNEAFAFVEKIEHDYSIPKVVEKDMEWNQCLVDTCKDYAEHMSDDDVTDESIKAYSMLLISLCRNVWLCFEQEKYNEALEFLAWLDKSLFSVSKLNQQESDNDDLEWDAILNESKGQLYWLSAIAIIHQAIESNIQWNDAIKLSAACYSVSLSFPIADISATWASWSKDNSFPGKLKTMSGFRLSQCAYMMYNLSSVSHTDCTRENEINEREWLREVTDNYCTEEGRVKVFQCLFGQNSNPETSMIHSDETFQEIACELISEDVLGEYDISAAIGGDLQTWVWMGLQWKQNFDNSFDPFSWISATFSDLQLAPSSIAKYGNIWNLFRLDVEAFVVACVLYAEKAGKLWSGIRGRNDDDALGMNRLPLPLCKKLVTENQLNWWDAVCKLHNKRNTERIFNTNQIKATLRHGLEAIRGSGNHGLQLLLIASLAKHFAAKACSIDKSGMGTSSIPWLAYQSRAAHYWMLALPLLQTAASNRIRRQTEPIDRLFPNTLNDPTVQEARGFISEVYMCNGSLLVQEGDLKRALDMYGKAETPHASFCEALIYKQLLENCDKEDSITTSGNRRRDTYRRKYIARLEITLNRLQRDPDEELSRRTETLLHECVSPSSSRTFKQEGETKRLFEETMSRNLPHIANHTVNSEVDVSVLPTIPSKQSTPKNEARPVEPIDSDKNGMMTQLTQNMCTLATAMSSLQLQFNENMNKMEQNKSQKQTRSGTEEKKEVVLESVVQQLAKLTTLVSELQEKKEVAESVKYQTQQEAMQLQLQQLQDQVNRSQFGTPIAPGRVVHLTQSEGQMPGSPMHQVYDPHSYQQAGLGQISSPMQSGNPYYNMLSYQQGYPPQSPALAAMYAQQGYILPQAQYGPRMPQQVLDNHGMPSPSHTPPTHVGRPQIPPSNAGLSITKEGADALSIRFQASLSGSASPTSMSRGGGVQSPALSRSGQPAQSQSAFTTLGFNQRDMPSGSASPFQRLPQSSSEPILGDQQQQQDFADHQFGHNTQFPGARTQPQQYEPDYSNMPNLTAHRYQQNIGLDESYLPPNVQNSVQPVTQLGEPSMLRTILCNGGSSAFQPAPPELQRRPELNYPEHINFPENKNQTAPSNTWNYKFQTPEEMDKANDKLKADEEAEDANTSQNDTGPHFEPIVRLSEVEVRTGEEDEEAVFSESAKLYRWTEGQWKERGVGVMKILKHKETGKYRILMRRDQILKICCNHLIGKDLELQAMPKSDKAWIWHALDFSEEESKQEGFAIRFKTPELANSFKEKFTEGKEINIKLSGGTPVRASTTAKVTSHKPASTVDTLPKTTNSIMAQGETKSSTSDVTIPKFSFAFPKPSAAAANLAAKIAGFPQKVVSTADQETKPESSNNDDDQNEDIHNESGDGPHFEPIVKLPDKVETKTGEEDEQVLYCHRVKLYKYTDKQWKEKGVGEMKILHNAGTKKSRIVMRRDQVLKLCANHYIIPEMKFSHLGNSDKAWTWTAVDHSDPDVEPKPEVLAVRFKTAEEASDFVKVVNQAKDILQGKDVSSLTTTVSSIKLSTQTTATTSSFKLSTVSTTTSQTTPQSIAQTQVSSTKGMLVVDKKAGAWNCSGCYALNEPTDSKCPCCGVPNPSAPKVEETKPSASTFAFGISSKPTGFSFGIPSTNASVSKPIFGNQQPVQSNSATLSFGSTGFTFGQNKSTSVTAVSTTSVFGVQTSEKSDTASTADTIPEPSVSQVSTTGVLKVTKKVGSWRCESCYVENEQDNANCQCCRQANPKTTQAPAGEAKPGLFGMNTNQGSKFSFGISSQPTVSSTKTSSSIVSPPKFMFGKSDASASFGFNQQQQTSNLFSNLSSTAPKSTSSTTGQLPKPRFPSVGDEEDSDEDEDDEDYTDDSSENLSCEDRDNAYNERYRSPLNRQEQQHQKEEESDSDVICIGEILPSEELQKKAENLMLPKHFYNFLKEGEENETGDDSETGDEKSQPKGNEKSSIFQALTTSVSTTTTDKSTFGFSAGATSFGDLIKSNTGDGFAFGNKPGGWIGMPEQKPLFASLTQGGDDDDGTHPSEENADIHFEPIARLPEKVEIITGEEDEEELYSQRCKLYRFNKPTNEWKERGTGEIKLKRHNKNGRIRIVMRREQIFKVCANHYIRPGMTMDKSKTSDRAWTWTAMDFADNKEPTMEIFTVRFKNTDQAEEFKAKFDECQMMLLDVDPMTPCKASSMRSKELSDKAEKMKNELKFFKDKFSEQTNIQKENSESSPTESGPLMVGSLTPLVQQHTQSLREKSEDIVKRSDDSILDTPRKQTENSFASRGNKFSFQPKADNNQQTPSRQHTTSAGSDDPQAESDIQFEPIYQLPDHVEIITGEEDEQILFGNRAKLYMFHKEAKQWKERGVGDIKILQHISTFKVRVLMRREQVLKVCLNHYVQPEIKLSFKEQTSAKTLLWTATDFSDSEKPAGETLQFALRFKNPDTASAFKNLWKEGAEAAVAETLLEPDESAINTSTIKPGVTSPGAVANSPQSPVDQPKPTFSFANVPSPFDAAKNADEGPHKVMGFVFGKSTQSESTPTTDKFKFDISKMSFNLGSTSTPQMGSISTPSPNFFTPPQNMAEPRTGAVTKSLFSEDSASDSTVNSNLYVTSSDTFSQADQSTVISNNESPTVQSVVKESSPSEQQIFTTTEKGYKPSPLAANFSNQGTVSVQSGNKFQFKPVVGEIAQKTTDISGEKKAENDNDDDDDVIFVSEAKPTEDQRRRAEKLMLPSTFFLYENKTLPLGFNEKLEEEKEDRILQFIEDRDSGKLSAKTGQKTNKAELSELDSIEKNTEPRPAVVTLNGGQTNADVGQQSIFAGAMLNLASSGGFASFADMASGVQNVGFKKDPSFQFPGAGQVMFQQRNTNENDDQDPSSYAPDTQFKPVLDKLPPLVEKNTGEEGEEILFKERCRLYRYDKDTNQWKERGVGDIKILFNDIQNVYRVVMRREQVLKVCANHVINEKTEPKYHLGSSKTCSYFTLDYTAGPTPTPEQFAFRFKTEDMCKTYMNKIEEVKELQQNESSC